MLKTTIDTKDGRAPVTIMRLEGELDASNYETLINETKELYADGTRNLLLDLENLSFVSSSGLVALHSMALIMRGETLENTDGGWGAFGAITRDLLKSTDQETHYKLLNPQPLVRKVLDTSGFSDIMPVYENETEAVGSFE